MPASTLPRSLAVPVLAAVLAVALVGCGSDPVPATTADDGSAAASAPLAAPDDAVHGGSTAASARLAFGRTSTDAQGLAVTVAAPARFTPAAGTSLVQQWPAYVALVVTVRNGGTAPYDPQQLFASVTSGSGTGEQVFDRAAGITGAPSAPVAAGASVRFTLGFGVSDPADLALEIAPDFDEPSALFGS